MPDDTQIDGLAAADALTEMLRGDQRLRWQQGQRVPVEAYFEHYPQLRTDPVAVRQLILGEMRLCRELGAPLELAEFLRRFPDEEAWLAVQHERMFYTSSRDDTSQSGEDEAPAGSWPALPGYDILEELGRGAMGVVFKAHQHRLSRVVALKMLLGGINASQRVRTRFRQEANAVAQLQHPYIVQIFDVVEHDGQLFLALEHIGGGSLTRRLRMKAFAPDEAAKCIAKVARAMHFAHERGIIHRDLKPSNILLTEDGIPKVTDFGLAKRLDDDTHRTQTGTVLGTPDYMPPEQAEGKVRELGPAAVVYSLGCVLYELLAGQPPFRGEALVRVLDAVRFQKPRPPSELRPGVPKQLEAVCLKCLEKAPIDRYPSAAGLADDLSRFLAGESVRAAASGSGGVRGWIQRNLFMHFHTHP
jgi:serine/threonine protein kinase